MWQIFGHQVPMTRSWPCLCDLRNEISTNQEMTDTKPVATKQPNTG